MNIFIVGKFIANAPIHNDKNRSLFRRFLRVRDGEIRFFRDFIIGIDIMHIDTGVIWEYHGTYTNKESAIMECKDTNHFVFKHKMNTPVPDASVEAPDCIYPLVMKDGILVSIDNLHINYWHENKGWYTDDEWCTGGRCPAIECGMCQNEYCAIHNIEPCDCDVIDRHDYMKYNQDERFIGSKFK